MPPSPITATVSPGVTPAVLTAAPMPVEAPQPSRHASTRSTPSGTRIACAACTTVCVASDADRQRPGQPAAVARVDPRRLLPGVRAAPRPAPDARGARPAGHRPHEQHGVAGRDVRHVRARPPRRCRRPRGRATSGTAIPSSRSGSPRGRSGTRRWRRSGRAPRRLRARRRVIGSIRAGAPRPPTTTPRASRIVRRPRRRRIRPCDRGSRPTRMLASGRWTSSASATWSPRARTSTSPSSKRWSTSTAARTPPTASTRSSIGASSGCATGDGTSTVARTTAQPRLGDLLIGRLAGVGRPPDPARRTHGHRVRRRARRRAALRDRGLGRAGTGRLGHEGRAARRVVRGAGAARRRDRRVRAHHLRVQSGRGDRVAVLRSGDPRARAPSTTSGSSWKAPAPTATSCRRARGSPTTRSRCTGARRTPASSPRRAAARSRSPPTLVGRLQAPQRTLARRDGERRHDPGRHPHERGAGAVRARARSAVARDRDPRGGGARDRAPLRRAVAARRQRRRATATSWHRPMEQHRRDRRARGSRCGLAAELGFELRDAATGGASDANTIAAAGTPGDRRARSGRRRRSRARRVARRRQRRAAHGDARRIDRVAVRRR